MIEALKQLKEKQEFLRFKYNVQCIINAVNNTLSQDEIIQIQTIQQQNHLDDVRACFSEKTGNIDNIDVFRRGLLLGKYMEQVHYRCAFDVTQLNFEDFQMIFDQMGKQILTFIGLNQNFIVLRDVKSLKMQIFIHIEQNTTTQQSSDKIQYIYYDQLDELQELQENINKNEIYDVCASSVNRETASAYSQCINQLKVRYISIYGGIFLNLSQCETIQAASIVNAEINNLDKFRNVKNIILWNVNHNFNDILSLTQLQRIYIAHCFTAKDDLIDQIEAILKQAKKVKYMHIDDDVVQRPFVLQAEVPNLEYLRLHFNPNIVNRRFCIIKEEAKCDKLQVYDIKFADKVEMFETIKEYERKNDKT